MIPPSLHSLEASRLLKYAFSLVLLVGVAAIGYCGLYFLWKIVLCILWVFYLLHLKKQYTTTQFDINDLNYPIFISAFLLILDGPIIICVDQTEKENWCEWIFKAKCAFKKTIS